MSQSWGWPTGEWPGYQDSWLRNPGYLGAGVSLLVVGDQDPVDPMANASSLVAGANPGLFGCRALGGGGQHLKAGVSLQGEGLDPRATA